MNMNTYLAFLRGINVGGHHKVPMAELRKELEKLNLSKVVTLLNSGNVIFDTNTKDVNLLKHTISKQLEDTFGFPIPIMLRDSTRINQLLKSDPFKSITITSDIRLYVSFLRKDTPLKLELPWTNEDESFKILDHSDDTLISVLDLSITKTPKGMEILEKLVGKDITTRNWNTLKRIEKKLETRH